MKRMVEQLLVLAKRVSAFLTMKRVFGMVALFLIIVSLVVVLLLQGNNIAVLNPKGVIAAQQFDLIVFTTLLGMVVVIPVFILLFLFAYRYRHTNKKAAYEPDQEGDTKLELLWWGIPIIIIVILSVVTWITTHSLDPYRAIESDKKPVKVQVVALQWKWLFLYPDYDVASVNELRIPVDTPIEFDITADAPMSAFWIPNLGSQTYAMNGMTAKLHLQADKAGEYPGYNTNINGEGYAKMRFKAIASSQQEFDQWTKNVAGSDAHLDWTAYETLAAPSKDDPVSYYMLHDTDIFDKIIAKYMDHGGSSSHDDAASDTMEHEGMNH